MLSYRFFMPLDPVSGAGRTIVEVSSTGTYDDDLTHDFLISGIAGGNAAMGDGAYLVSSTSLEALDAADGTVDGDIDLSNALSVTGNYFIGSPQNNQFIQFGREAEFVNLDADTTHEIVISAPGDDTAGSDAGAVFVLDADDLPSLDAADGTIDGIIDAGEAIINDSYTLYGGAARGQFGAQIAEIPALFTSTLGDDLMIGAPNYDPSGPNFGVHGQTWFISGEEIETLDRIDGADDNVITLDANTTDSNTDVLTPVTQTEGDSGHRFGSDIAIVGEVFDTANDAPQLLIGAPSADAGAGIVYLQSAVAFGTADALDGTVDGDVREGLLGGYSFHGRAAPEEDGIGLGFGTAGDIDGDGLNDLLIAGREANSGGSDRGVLYVVTAAGIVAADTFTRGGQNFEIDLPDAVGTQQGGGTVVYAISGTTNFARFPQSLTSLGDIDGDGMDDFALGLPAAGANGGGAVYVISAPTLGFADAADGVVDGQVALDVLMAQTGNYTLTGSGASGLGSDLSYFLGRSVTDRALMIGDESLDIGTPQQADQRGGGYLVQVNQLLALDTADGAGDGQISMETLTASVGGVDICGTGFGNMLSGLTGDDTICGRGGDDTLLGGAGDDVLIGGDPNALSNADGADAFNGGEGSDTVSYAGSFGSLLVDLLFPRINTFAAAGDSYSSIENLTGSQGADNLRGTYGDNFIQGGRNVDYLFGRQGNDTLDGGVGNDVLFGGPGADVLRGGADIDRAQYSQSLTAIVASLTDASQNTGEAAGDSYDSIEGLAGSAFDDRLTGETGGNQLFGREGNDTLLGLDGDDYLNGGGNNDRLDGGAGNDTLRGGSSRDTFVFNDGADVVEDWFLDFIELDAAALGISGLNAGQVVTQLGTAVGADFVLDFDNGDTLTLQGQSEISLTQLAGFIEIA